MKSSLSKLSEKLMKSGTAEVINPENYEVTFIPTGSLSLDIATGGGYPRGRITELAGWESTGKTAHALMAARNVQSNGGTVAFIDLEYTFDKNWAHKIGVDTSDDKFLWLRVYDLESAGDIIIEVANAGVDMIILDSVAAAPIKALNAGDLGDSNMGKVAKIMSDMMRKIVGPLSRNNTVMLFINQLRDSLNIYNPKPVTPGGKALPFFASTRIFFKAKREKSDNPSYVTITATVEKNKLSAPGKVAEYEFSFIDANVEPISELVNILTDETNSEILGIKRAGAWYTLPKAIVPTGEDRFQGSEKIAEYLADKETFVLTKKYVIEKFVQHI